MPVQGTAREDFQGVRDAFSENFMKRNELGGACCIYYRGEKVVDLWGGVRNKQTTEPWEEHTMVVVHSTTKGLAAMTLALAHSRGWLDYDERVCTYWPEFAQHGKDKITVRQLLAHQAALFAINEEVDRELLHDFDRFAIVLARQIPEWEPGTKQAYHGLSLGFYESELLRRIDPQHRSLGRFFQEEIAQPLGAEFYIGLPEEIPNERLAVMDTGNILVSLLHFPFPLFLAAINPHSEITRALGKNPGTNVYMDSDRIYARDLEVPSGGGVGTARGIATAYNVFASGGKQLGLCADTLQELMAPARPLANGFYDEALKTELPFSLGFMKPGKEFHFGHQVAFGSPGAGGSMGFADPESGVAYGYVTNRMGSMGADPRDAALRAAMWQAIGERF